MVPIICILFQLGAKEVLQRMKIICYARPELLNPIHDGDRGLQFFPVNWEFPVSVDHKREVFSTYISATVGENF